MNHRQKTCLGEKLLQLQLAIIIIFPTKIYLHAHKVKNCDASVYEMILVDETRTYLDCFTEIVSAFPCDGVGYLCNLKMLRISCWQRAL